MTEPTTIRLKDIPPGTELFIYAIPKEGRLERLANFLEIDPEKLIQLKQQLGRLSALREHQGKPDILTEEEHRKLTTFLKLSGEFAAPESLPMEPDIAEVVRYAAGILVHRDFETLAVVPFSGVTPYALETVARGTASAIYATVSDVFRAAVRYNADSVLLIHNHPEGQLIPSEQDIKFTERCVKAGEILEIAVLDSIIVTSVGWYSIGLSGLVEGLIVEPADEDSETGPIILAETFEPNVDGTLALPGNIFNDAKKSKGEGE